MEKRCSKCGVQKAVSEFSRDTKRKDGLQPHCKACNKAYRDARAAERIEYNRLWRSKNRDRFRETQRKYQRGTRDKCRAASLRWYYANKPKALTSVLRRRNRLQVTDDELAAIEGYQRLISGDRCVYCLGPVEHIDHIRPLAHGGPHVWDNLAPTCAGCNLSKGTKSVLAFMLAR